MSTCISRAGEYSDHEAGDWCPRCGTFNEEGIVTERNLLRQVVEGVRGQVDNLERNGSAAMPVFIQRSRRILDRAPAHANRTQEES